MLYGYSTNVSVPMRCAKAYTTLRLVLRKNSVTHLLYLIVLHLNNIEDIKCDIVTDFYVYESSTTVNSGTHRMQQIAVRSCLSCATSCVQSNDCNSYNCNKVTH